MSKFHEGAFALYRGYELSENPYDPVLSPQFFSDWVVGWRSAAREVESA